MEAAAALEVDAKNIAESTTGGVSLASDSLGTLRGVPDVAERALGWPDPTERALPAPPVPNAPVGCCPAGEIVSVGRPARCSSWGGSDAGVGGGTTTAAVSTACAAVGLTIGGAPGVATAIALATATGAIGVESAGALPLPKASRGVEPFPEGGVEVVPGAATGASGGVPTPGPWSTRGVSFRGDGTARKAVGAKPAP